MTLRHLVWREIFHRKLNFGLGVLSTAIAVGVLVSQLTALQLFDLRTDHLLQAKSAETEEFMSQLEDDYRVITRDMGHNVLILPNEASLDRFYREGHLTARMPEEFVFRLADSPLLTIRHLLPIVEQQIEWPEQNRSIILVGTRGQATLAHADPRRPIQEAVAQGRIVLGYRLWSELGLRPGDTVQFRGEELIVEECYNERGSKDDVSAWIDLVHAQRLLNYDDEINGILALKCFCADGDNTLEAVRNEITALLDDVQVIEFHSMALARDLVRGRAAEAAAAAVRTERINREQLRGEREAYAAWFVPMVLLGCFAWVGLLAFANAKDRAAEIGVFRAIGLRASQVQRIFLARAALLGAIGALIGCGVGIGVAIFGGAEALPIGQAFLGGLPLVMTLGVLLFAPLLSMMASAIPAAWAAAQDPALVLREE